MGVAHKVMVVVRRSGDNRWELALSFRCVDPRTQTLVIRLGGKYLYPLSNLTTSKKTLNYCNMLLGLRIKTLDGACWVSFI